jgi:hypothetical protein
VSAENRDDHEQEAERDRPGRDPVGTWPHPLSGARPWARARNARRGRGCLHKHQPSSGLDFAHTATRRGREGRTVARGYAALTHAILAIAAALDSLTDVLDFSPPGMSLGCSWHRRDDDSAVGGRW